jgi:hypothetical protein
MELLSTNDLIMSRFFSFLTYLFYFLIHYFLILFSFVH